MEETFATAISGFPSPSRSPTATSAGPVPVSKLTGDAKELEVNEPLLLMLRYIYRVFDV